MATRWQEIDCCISAFGYADIPAEPGVYVILCGEDVLYVGQSKNLRVRIPHHRISRGYAKNIRTPWGEYQDNPPIRCKVKTSRRLGDWALLEIRLIHRLRPLFNSTYQPKREAA